MALSLRLQAILDLVQGSQVLADIGTDHALLPIEAMRRGFCKKAIACDINKGPLDIAAANISGAGFAAQIETRLGDGLQPIRPMEADCVVISGMGGTRIWHILQSEPTKAQYAQRLILQPQHNLETLRKNLHAEGYAIETEKLICEDRRFYVILLARYTGAVTPWAPQEYFLGKDIAQSPLFPAYLEYHQEKISRYIQSVKDENDRAADAARLKWIEEVL